MKLTRHSSRIFGLMNCGFALLFTAGCATHSGLSFSEARYPSQANCGDGSCTSSVQIVQGQPNKVVDGAGWVLGIPRKIILWDRRVDSHKVREETVNDVAQFADAYQLQDVCVRVNQYAPVDEWKRLTQNDRVSPGWRYTMGTLSLIGYTLVPGRLFGGDDYNPYTNSVYVYSDIPALGMEAAAYAKDVQNRQYPGTYAASNSLPLVSIWHETINTQDTLAYLEANGNELQQQEGVRILYPNYGASFGGALDSSIGVGPILEIGGAIIGHATGAYRASRIHVDQSATAWVENYNQGSEVSIRSVSMRQGVAR